jgi:hypothetical protein
VWPSARVAELRSSGVLCATMSANSQVTFADVDDGVDAKQQLADAEAAYDAAKESAREAELAFKLAWQEQVGDDDEGIDAAESKASDALNQVNIAFKRLLRAKRKLNREAESESSKLMCVCLCSLSIQCINLVCTSPTCVVKKMTQNVRCKNGTHPQMKASPRPYAVSMLASSTHYLTRRSTLYPSPC